MVRISDLKLNTNLITKQVANFSSCEKHNINIHKTLCQENHHVMHRTRIFMISFSLNNVANLDCLQHIRIKGNGCSLHNKGINKTKLSNTKKRKERCHCPENRTRDLSYHSKEILLSKIMSNQNQASAS